MEDLIIEKRPYIPSIIFNCETGIFEINGKSYPENTYEIYEPVLKWLNQYFADHADKKTIVNVTMPYCNSSTSKVLYDIFFLMNEAVIQGKDVEINWFYDKEDEANEEEGQDFKEDFDELPFNLVPQ